MLLSRKVGPGEPWGHFQPGIVWFSDMLQRSWVAEHVSWAWGCLFDTCAALERGL